MSEITSELLKKVYKSRKTLVSLMETAGYNVENYANFTLSTVNIMMRNEQLDMFVSNEKNKMYVKYFDMDKAFKGESLQLLIMYLYGDNILSKKDDTLVIVIKDAPKGSVIEDLKTLYENEGIFIVIHHLDALQFNILDHVLVPKHEILSDAEELVQFKKRYNILDGNLEVLPKISRFDPVALAIFIRPGEVCRIQRRSPTSGLSYYYRLCIHPSGVAMD